MENSGSEVAGAEVFVDPALGPIGSAIMITIFLILLLGFAWMSWRQLSAFFQLPKQIGRLADAAERIAEQLERRKDQ